MIQNLDKDGRVPKAMAVCDECGRKEVIPCDYERRGTAWQANEAQARTKIIGKGWAFVKGSDRCPTCEAKRKAFKPKEQQTEPQKEPEMSNVTELRKPSREQRRAIISILDEVYDVTAGRYKGAETDVTVADAVGGGCMFGWVAEIRVETYGDSGDNEESGQQAAAIVALTEQVNAMQTALTSLKLDVSRFADRQAAFAKTLGPKAKVV